MTEQEEAAVLEYKRLLEVYYDRECGLMTHEFNRRRRQIAEKYGLTIGDLILLDNLADYNEMKLSRQQA